MSRTALLTIAYTPDSHGAFNYFAMETGETRLPGFLPEFHRRAISDLNRAALNGVYDVTAISAVQYPAVAHRYAILGVGTCVGRGYGPVLAGKHVVAMAELRGRKVGVGGLSTTGCFLLRTFCPEAIPVEMPVNGIGPAVAAGDLDAGVMIHEEMLAYPRLGLQRIADLGAEWHRRCGLPLPVGLNLIRRTVQRETMTSVAAAVRRSLEYGLRHQDEAFAWLVKCGHASPCTKEFVAMFANTDAMQLQDDVRLGLTALVRQAAERSGAEIPPLDIVDGPAPAATSAMP